MPGTPPTTTRRGLPRVGEGDAPDIPRDINALADALDASVAALFTGTLASRAAYSNPLDGDFWWATDDTSVTPNGSLAKWDEANGVWRPILDMTSGAFAGTAGTPSNTNRFVTDNDSRHFAAAIVFGG